MIHSAKSSAPADAVATRPLLVTSDAGLMDAVLAVAAEARVEVVVAPDIGSAAGHWATAPLVMVDLALLVGDPMPPSRPGLVVVSRVIEDAQQWRSAVAVSPERIVELPEGAPWLFERFGRSLEVPSESDIVVVLGAVGGAGTSSLAAAMARYAHDHHSGAILVDLEAGGGGIDVLVGAETVSGARWDELAGVSGPVDEQVLIEALPAVDGVTVLSWPSVTEIEPDAAAVGYVLDACARTGRWVVVDGGREVNSRNLAALSRATRVVVVVPLRVRAIGAARRLLHRLPPHLDPVVVAREPAPGGLVHSDVVRALGVPVAATLPDDRRRAEVEELGGPIPASAAWRRVCEQVAGRSPVAV